ncbi:MAG: LexA family protein [Phototrophicaceae bacterium]|jgi:SOS-response transcriptional repressor LexA
MAQPIYHPITQSVLDCIEQYVRAHGFAPTQREIAQHCFIAKGTVERHLQRLELSGHIQLVPNIARGIVLLQLIDEKWANAHPLRSDV